MLSTPMNERNIAYFPMQSTQIGTDEQGDLIYDNAADADILQNMRQREIKDGVYPDVSTYLQVMSNSDMTITVMAGYAHVQGIQVWVKEDTTLTVEDADLLVDRVDRVVLRLSLVDREVTLAVKKGDISLTRITGQTWELGLADLAVAKNNAIITQAEITDLRLNTTACGIVSGLMQVDTESIFNQYMTWWETQQDTTGYLTVNGDNPSLNTVSKKVLGAINEVKVSNDEKVKITDIVNTLTNTSVDKPLSAAQGKALNDSTVKTTGNQSIAGTKTFDTGITMGGQGTIPIYWGTNFIKKTDEDRLGIYSTNGVDILATAGGYHALRAVAYYLSAQGSRIGINGANLGLFSNSAVVEVLNTAGSAYGTIIAAAHTIGSSNRWKDNINPFTNEESQKLLQIELKTFSYKSEYSDDGGKVHMGVIAEQIAELFPDAVTLDTDGLPSGVDYSKLVIPCIGMIQQQQKEIEELRTLTGRMEALLVSKGILTQDEIDSL